MPRWLQAVAQVLPLHAAVELVRPLFFGRWDAQALLHLLILGAYLAGGWWLARRFTQRRFAA
jgi:lipooligosaccharide transport system permease protein